MRPWNGRLRLSWMAGALVLALITLSGCAEVEIHDATPEAETQDAIASPLPAGSHAHNLAVLAVDFEPSLDYQQLIIHRQSITLSVAVENTGTSTERDVTVRAQLSTPEDPDLLLTQDASVASIAPGEIQLVRFARLGNIPYHQIYRLEVTVDPVDGEGELGDNYKAFDIQIHQQDSTE